MILFEYKEIAQALVQVGVLGEANGALLRELAGYRNRLVHFYHQVSDLELYEICTQQLGDVETLLTEIVAWIKVHPEDDRPGSLKCRPYQTLRVSETLRVCAAE
jgi:uncharacterized protein YutE (UPF0331/DUF86 family)